MPSKQRAPQLRYVPRPDRWHPTTQATLQRLPMAARCWLGWPDSLTERLSTYLNQRIEVRVLSERCDRLLPDERSHLDLYSHRARVREVRLEAGGVAYVMARTVFPDTTARVMNQALRDLGTKSLGSLLFGALRAPVRHREFTRLEPGSSLVRVLHQHLPEFTGCLWARRALHLLQGQPLLVTEIFLPTLLAPSSDP